MKKYIDLTPSWEGTASIIAQLASDGNPGMKAELRKMARLADAACPLANALQVFLLTPATRAFLDEHDPKAVAQAEKALKAIKAIQP